MSIAQSSGSTVFGDTLDDVHQFTGSLNISGSVSSTGSFGAISVAGMSVSNLADVSSSIASRVTTNEGKATKGFTIAMSVAL